MQIDVIQNGKKNLIAGFANKIILLICPFIEKTVIQYTLGAQYLGLGSLFSAILSVLSITELGFSTAVVYHMYKPAAEGDTVKINALLAYYKKAYRMIGLTILGVGLLIIPFLGYLIKGSYPEEINLTAIYLVYLANTVVSYFLYSYLESILVVYQQGNIKSTINSFVRLMLLIFQVLTLLLTKNYYCFAVLMPLFTVVTNLWTAWRVHQLYPQYHAEGKLSTEELGSIRRVVAGTFVQRACIVTRNSLDSICISAYLGLAMTAIYNNYYTVLAGIIAFVNIVSASFMGGIGNHVATRSVKENYEEMKKLDFVYLWLGGWCTVCLLCLFQPFMLLWMGPEMMLPFPVVCLLCLYFYLLRLGEIRYLYTSANGLWWEQRHRAIAETAMNLVLNIVLGKLLGVYGIVIATIISLFLCNYLWSVGIVFKHYFSMERIKDYYLYQGKQSLLVLIACLITYGICAAIPLSGLLAQLIVRSLICITVPNALFYLVYRKNQRFLYAKNKIFGRIRQLV